MRCTAARRSSCAGSAASGCAGASRARDATRRPGDKVDVPPKKVPYFKPGKELKELINREPEAPLSPGLPRRRPATPDTDLAGVYAGAGAYGARAAAPMDHLWSPWRLDIRDRRRTASDGCVFCDASSTAGEQSDLIVFRGPTCFVILNLYPYNNGHLMVVPNRHIAPLATRRTTSCTS